MIRKRFIIDDDGIVTDMVDLSMYIDNDDCCEKLNELNDENRQLKADNNRLVNETAKVVAEHQSKVLDLIDNKVEELEKRYKVGQLNYGCPMHNIRFGINVLKELKKELTK